VIAGAGLWIAATLTTPLLGAVAAVALLAALSGALHLDGLADAADGLLGGDTPERRLDIMRDPRVGSFGVVAVCLVILGDVAALAGLSHATAVAALVTAAAEARMALVVVVLALPYVRATGLGTVASGGRRAPALALAGVTAALPLLLDWRHGLLALALVAVTTSGIAWLARSRVGGATGDVYGTVVEVGQLAALAAFAVRL
jgi:adenosylcobinamide-GDP ribazoletransferase